MIKAENLFNIDYNDSDIEKITDEMTDAIQTVQDNIDFTMNTTFWEDDKMIEEKEIFATGLDDEPIAKVRIESETPEVIFAIEDLIENTWKK